MKARTLKAAILRMLSEDNEPLIAESRSIDPLDMGTLYECALRRNDLSEWKSKMREPAHNYLELALDYMKAGFYEDAFAILDSCADSSPMLPYYKGYIYELKGEMGEAARMHQLGEAADSSYCFPNRPEEVLILESAVRLLEDAPFAHYYLGCLLYDKKQYEKAVSHWESAAEKAPGFGMNWRNLAIAYYNRQNDIGKALECMAKACSLDPSSSRFLLEYDQLRARAGVSAEDRLALLGAHLELVEYRDALYVEYITLLNNTGQYDKALDCLNGHKFHPWEGGEGKVSTQYRYALTQKALKLLADASYDEAICLLDATKAYPENLGEGKLPNVQDNMADYYLGMAYKAKGDSTTARSYFEKASTGLEEPSSVLYYNDQPSDTILYQGLANEELGNRAAARKCYHQLLAFGEKHIFDNVTYDYFAVSLPEIEVFPENIKERNDIYCQYLMALGNIGLEEKEKAAEILHKILATKPDYQGAVCHLPLAE